MSFLYDSLNDTYSERERKQRISIHGLPVIRVNHLSNQPPRSTQPCIPPGSLNRVPALAGVKAGMSPLPGGR